MLYGKASIHPVRDVTDLIGVRTLVLKQCWQVTAENPGQAEIDAAKPAAPGVPGGLTLMGDQTLKERGRFATLWTYQGINGNGKSVTFKNRQNSIDYGFDGGFAQVAIQLNKYFEQMRKQFGGWPSNDGTTILWPPTIPSGSSGGRALKKDKPSEGGTNPMYGIQAFFEMEGIYRFRYAEIKLPPDLEDGVGFIADTLPGEPPSLKDGRNWLKATAVYQRKGVVHDITEYYWASRLGGWPDPVYRRNYFSNK